MRVSLLKSPALLVAKGFQVIENCPSPRYDLIIYIRLY
jgi:hypothetical protein